MLNPVGDGLLVIFDNKARMLRVFSNAPLIPGFKALPLEVANFTNRDTWEKSEYRPRVTGEGVTEMIEWFWTDLAQEEG